MADEQDPQAPDEANDDAAHAVPGEDAAEIAGSAEDAPLEALQEAQEAGAPLSAPEQPDAQPAGEGHAVPSADAQEIAGSAEDAPLEAAQEAQDAEAVQAAESEEEEEDAPREKPAVP